METIIENWQIVTVLEGESSIGKVLWGICIEDMSFRFTKDDYICTSKLVEINPKEGLVKTASGSIYQVVGRGGKASIDYRDFELLRNGFSPEQIEVLNTTKLLQ